MNGADFIEFAGKLAANPSASPAACRTAISRAYYGAFHSTLSFLQIVGLDAPRGHKLHFDFLESGQPEAFQVGELLSELQSRRVQADYEMGNTRIETVVQARLNAERAFKLLSLLRGLEQEPARSKVKAGIEAYRQRITGKSQS